LFRKNGYVIEFSKPINKNNPTILVAKFLLSHIPFPKPRTITQDEVQFARFEGNLYYNTSYTSNLDEIYIHINSERHIDVSKNIIFDSDTETFSSKNGDVEPYSSEPFFVNYFCATHFLTITNYTRDVTVSTMAACQIEEKYEVKNTGAELVGEFSRFKIMVL
jgi:hypothetical protein